VLGIRAVDGGPAFKIHSASTTSQVIGQTCMPLCILHDPVRHRRAGDCLQTHTHRGTTRAGRASPVGREPRIFQDSCMQARNQTRALLLFKLVRAVGQCNVLAEASHLIVTLATVELPAHAMPE
jgi:hypothetical protein